MADSKESRLTDAFREDFAKALTADVPPNEKLEKCIDILFKHNLAYVLEKAFPGLFLTHKENRGKLMLSPYNAHGNAVRIKRAGANLKALINAIAIELAPIGKLREENIQANALLIKRSQGLLAEISGMERYLTVGCGHTVAFCKHAAVGGKTIQPELMDAKGNIDKQLLFEQEAFKVMITEGWKWTIIPFEVDEAFPNFAKIAQIALNTGNHVASVSGELETSCTIAEYAEDTTLTSERGWQERVAESITELNLPAARYARTLIDFTTKFGGGPGAPMIKFMDAFAKQYGCTAVLGEVFWVALTYTKFTTVVDEHFTLVRISLAIVNLVCTKVEDGIAKTLVKTDLVRLSAKKQLATIREADQVLSDVLVIIEGLQPHHELPTSKFMRPAGQAFVRIGLWATAKQSLGPEINNKFTVDEIKACFLKGVGEIVGQEVKYDKWVPVIPPLEGQGQGEETPRPVQATASIALKDYNNIKFWAEQHGFKEGNLISERGVPASTVTCFKITEITDKEIKISSCASYSDDSFSSTLSLQDLAKGWHVVSWAPPFKLNPLSPHHRPVCIDIDRARCELFLAVSACDCTSVAVQGLQFWRKPDQLRTGPKSVAVHKLMLAPIAPLANITTKSGPGSVSLGSHDVLDFSMDFYISQPSRPAATDGDKPAATAFIVPFWWVSDTTSKSAANMELTHKLHNGIDVPMYTNRVEIPPYTVLARYVAPVVKAPSRASAIIGQSTKKARKS